VLVLLSFVITFNMLSQFKGGINNTMAQKAYWCISVSASGTA
jgi:hypothetical protein